MLVSACRRDTATPTLRAAADDSFSTTGYLAIGLASPDREWFSADYILAAQALTKLADSKPNALPRRGSGTSGAVFSRLCNPSNLNLLNNRGLPVVERLPAATDYLFGSRDLLMAYVKATERSGVGSFGDELVDVMGFQFQIVTNLFNLSDEFLASLPANDSRREVRKEGIEKMKSGASSLIAGAFLSLTEIGIYTPEQRMRLVDYLKQTVPAISGRLPSATQTEFLLRTKSLSKSEKHHAVRQRLNELADAMQKHSRSPVNP